MRKRTMAAAPKASVAITNPTRYVVALKDKQGMTAPLSVAKGVIAGQIREVGDDHHIPIAENPPLARAARDRGVRPENPVRAYQAVAEVIGDVMRLNRAVAGTRYAWQWRATIVWQTRRPLPQAGSRMHIFDSRCAGRPWPCCEHGLLPAAECRGTDFRNVRCATLRMSLVSRFK